MRARTLAATAAISVALAGCRDPYAQTTPTTESAVDVASRTGESPAAPQTAPAGGAGSAERAISDFAHATINWTWRDLAARQQRLAAGAVGQAREQAQVLATTAAHDREMRRGRITHSGTVQSITPKRGADRVWIVVTLEQSGSENDRAYDTLPPSWHVTLASAREIDPGRWVVSTWRPQR